MSSYRDASEDGEKGIFNRRMTFCPYLRSNFDTDELIRHCPDCLRFFAISCSHYRDDREAGTVCHNLRLVFTDGACLGNGREDATAGLGVAIGFEGEDTSQWAIPVVTRWIRRAELLAALEGIRKISEVDGPFLACSGSNSPRGEHSDGTSPTGWIVVTDSEYVVRGMTEWFPVWKVCAPSILW
ncbi:hypothetical protein SERLADRAFT_445080 [Serpula lacrymans var. lacrymans S7.9]|uniref:RNase H type-1 domain-containing protein n=1 Tax=Serpula lacrymans var. lacrymans (strain S7.9) TaxID=578457 RepID=F8NIA4_SERL9|nr:uncharacterized protein SERLADRAFT_445080 [Serpula lacrymans var. lacrymans S7.9]EGO29251.1 hypothetical protein SERLADRAFT_445080 [Serpula lacrymans var. lacrymans S7.9]